MNIRFFTSIFIALLCMCSCNTRENNDRIYEAGVSDELAELRKKNIQDTRYLLTFNIPECKDSMVEGDISLAFEIEQQQEIIIDFRETENVKRVCINGRTANYRLANEHIIIGAEDTEIGENRIDMTFIAGNQSLNRNEEFMYTLLVPDRARTVFPCFDQPDMKAAFELMLTVPKEWTAISNSPVESIDTAGTKNRIKFKETEPLSTYLFSFVAGKFMQQTYDKGKHKLTAYHRETDRRRIAQLPEIFEQVEKSLVWLEDYTGIDYPFAKYHFIILPGFQYGGMEHTGATLYNDNRMFLPEKPTMDEVLARASLIAHETAHMWFGDFVTMKWFDDVWTKEVFANYFAERITEPMFPGINHRLNWLKKITTPAMSEDRTLGGTSIRQTLDNMNNAGLIYNNIIYDKAPVMLEKLIELMGEDEFRKGILEYLSEYAYGNATWNDLIGILDNRCDKDLAEFSHVWVNSKGMPFIDFALKGDTLIASQNDPYGRGLTWAQNFKVMLIGDSIYETEISMNGTADTICTEGNVMHVLPNSDGRGYGYFRYDKKSLAWALDNWHRIDNETCRQAQLMNMNEAYEHGEVDAATWLTALLKGLPQEKNELIASTVCSYLEKPIIDMSNKSGHGYSYTKEMLEMAKSHKLISCRQQLMRTLISNAADSLTCKELYNIWKEGKHKLLNENDYMNMAYELAIYYPSLQQEIISRQRERISNPDRIRQFDYISRATAPDTAEQQRLFKELLRAENRRIEPWALKTLGYLCHHSREQMAVSYIGEALDSLEYIQRTSDIFFPQSWTGTLLRNRKSKEAAKAIKDFTDRNEALNPLLKNKIMLAAWNVMRRTKEND